MANRIVKLSEEASNANLSLLERYPRSKPIDMKPNNNCQDQVVYGSNLSSTIRYPFYTKITRHMIKIPKNTYNMLIGVIISDGWLIVQKSEARFGFKQSLDKFEYFYTVFSKLTLFILPRVNKD